MPVGAAAAIKRTLSYQRPFDTFAILPIEHGLRESINIARRAVHGSRAYQKRIVLEWNVHQSVWRKIVILRATFHDCIAIKVDRVSHARRRENVLLQEFRISLAR